MRNWQRFSVVSIAMLFLCQYSFASGMEFSLRDKNPTTTKGDVSTHDGTAPARLAVGTNGQVLSADSSTTTGLAWTNSKSILPIGTKGDIIVSDGANHQRLAVGNNGQILSADSSTTTGLTWIAAPTTSVAGGLNGNVQYNRSGSTLAGDVSFNWNQNANTLGISRDAAQTGYAIVISSDNGTTALGNISHDGSAFVQSIEVPDNATIGLGASKGAIEFDDQATDEVNVTNAFVGLGTSTPAVRLDVNGTAYIKPAGSTPTVQVVAGTDPATTVGFTTDSTAYGWQLGPVVSDSTQTVAQVLGQGFSSSQGQFGVYLGDHANSAFQVVRRSGNLNLVSTSRLGVTTFTPSTANNTPVIVKGFAAQASNLQEWQNSSSGILANVSADGSAFFQSVQVTTPRNTARISLPVQSAKISTDSSQARIDGGLYFWRLLYSDDRTDKNSAIWQGRIDDNWQGGPLTAKIDYYMTSSDSTSTANGSVTFVVQLMAYTSGDAVVITNPSFGSEVSKTQGVPTVLSRDETVTIPMTSLDGIAAGDTFFVRLKRDGADTITGDVAVVDFSVT